MVQGPLVTFLLVAYGLPFFILWVVVTILTKKESRFTISKTIWLIGGFGLSHGIHEWTEFLNYRLHLNLDVIDDLSLVISFGFLIQFGVSTLVFSSRRNRLVHLISLAPLALWFFLVTRHPNGMTTAIGDVYARYTLGLLGCFLTAGVLFMQRTEIGKTGQRRFMTSLSMASGGFLFYGLLSGLIVPEVGFLPSFLPTYTSFYRTTGLPVQVFRAVAIGFIGYAMIRLLRIFEWEGIHSVLSAKKELEQRVQERTAELAKSNETLKLIIETEPECVKTLSADGTVLQMNRAGVAMLGAGSEEQVVGKTLYSMVEGKHRQGFQDLTERVFRGESGIFEFELTGFQGRRLCLETHAAPLRNEKNEIIALLGITRDITEQSKAAVSLQQSEQRYRQLFENMHEGLLIQEVVEDAAGNPIDLRYIEVNPATERFLGKRRADIIGKTRSQVLNVPDPEVIDVNSRIIRTGQPVHLVRYSAGAGRWYESFSYPVGTRQVATLFVDITERKSAEARVQQSEAKYRNLFESSMDGIFILDPSGMFIDANRTAYTRLGYTKDEMLSLHISKFDTPEFAALVPERMKQIREQGFAVFESAHVRKDGTLMPVEVNARLLEYEGRQVYFSIVRDITERKKSEQELRDLNRNFVIFLENTTDMVYFKDENSRFRFCSQTLADITGHASWRDMIGKHDLEVFPKDVAEIYHAEELPVFQNGAPLLNKTDPYYDSQGRMGWVSTSKWPVFGEDNKVIGIFGISRDITERKKMEEEMRHMAQHDSLTGLPNRSLFADILKVESAQARRHQSKLAILFLDLDRFKDINDTLGHDAGDQLLKEVSNRIAKNVRESDTLARIGGDEFNILVADLTSLDAISEVAQKIIASFEAPFEVAGQELHITTSMGISVYPEDSDDMATLLRYADIAMYFAKERGKNNFQFYNPEINSRSLERIRLETMLRQTINRREIEVYYQPQVNITTREVVGAEALARWNHPEQGILEPKDFIPMAEETGFITTIDEYVLRAACVHIRQRLDAGLRPVCITTNLSAREFQNPDLTTKIAALLQETGAPPEYLVLEITESLAMNNIERTIKRLKEFVQMGVHVSIDDFGTGYSSLNYLKRLPVENIKIDQSFIRDIATDADDRTIIHAVTAMAHTMKLKVTAEGVETEEQLEFLKGLDCDEAQGYLFSTPLPAQQFEELIGAGK